MTTTTTEPQITRIVGTDFDGTTIVKVDSVEPKDPRVWHHFTAEENAKAAAGQPHTSTCGITFKPTKNKERARGRHLGPMQKCVICQSIKSSNEQV